MDKLKLKLLDTEQIRRDFPILQRKIMSFENSNENRKAFIWINNSKIGRAHV